MQELGIKNNNLSSDECLVVINDRLAGLDFPEFVLDDFVDKKFENTIGYLTKRRKWAMAAIINLLKAYDVLTEKLLSGTSKGYNDLKLFCYMDNHWKNLSFDWELTAKRMGNCFKLLNSESWAIKERYRLGFCELLSEDEYNSTIYYPALGLEMVYEKMKDEYVIHQPIIEGFVMGMDLVGQFWRVKYPSYQEYFKQFMGK